jgi:hypothetical protein
MFYVYYWVHNIITNEKKIFRFENFAGDVGEKLIINNITYIIDALSAEYQDFDEPEVIY